jgi:hypothetical protein
LSADEKFLMMLKEKCAQTDQEFNQRQKTRSEEIAAVGKALEFLSSDAAHDLFTNTFNFVQVDVRDLLSYEYTRIYEYINRLETFGERQNIIVVMISNDFQKSLQNVIIAIDFHSSDLHKKKK